MKKRSLIALLMATMMIGSMVVEAAAETTEEAGGLPLEGHTISLSTNETGPDLDTIIARVDAFEAATGCTVEVEMTGLDSDDSEALLLTRAATGNLPDVLLFSGVGAKLREFDMEANLLDLSGQPFVERMTDDFVKGASSENGGIYAIPNRTVNVAGVFYNKPLYEELGLEIPTTWDEFLANCEVIKTQSEADPVFGAYENTAGRQILFLAQYWYVKQENPDFAAQYTNKEIGLADSPAYMRGLEKLYELNELGYLNDDPLAATFDDSAIAIAEGTAAHTFSRTNIVGTIGGVAPDSLEDVGFFPLPDENADELGVAVWLPNCWVASKNTKDPEAVYELFDFFLSDEGLEAYSSACEVAGAFAVKGAQLPDDVATSVKEAQEWASKASCTVMEYECDIKGANMPTILSMVATGELTPEEGVAELEADNAIDARQKGVAGW